MSASPYNLGPQDSGISVIAPCRASILYPGHLSIGAGVFDISVFGAGSGKFMNQINQVALGSGINKNKKKIRIKLI